MTKYAKTVRRTNPTYTAKFSGRSARGEDTYVVDRDGRFFAEGPVRALFVSYMRSPEWDAISAALGTAGADVRRELRKKLTNPAPAARRAMIRKLAEQATDPALSAEDRAWKSKRLAHELDAAGVVKCAPCAKKNPARSNEIDWNVAEFERVTRTPKPYRPKVGDWVVVDPPRSMLPGFNSDLINVPGTVSRIVGGGTVVINIGTPTRPRDAWVPVEAIRKVRTRRTPAPRAAKTNPAFRRSPYGGVMVTRDGVDWHVLPVKRGAPSSYASTAHWQAAKGGSWQVVAVPAGSPVGGYRQQAWPFNDGATARAAALALPAPSFASAAASRKPNPAKARSARAARGGKRKSFQVQSYEFEIGPFTEARAKAWLKQHGYRSAIDEGPEFYHARQHSPSDYQKGTLHTIAIAKHVQAIVGIPKRGSDASEASGYGARGPRQGRLFGAKGARSARSAAPVYDDEVPF